MDSVLIRILQVLVVLFSKFENSYYFQLTLLHSNNINFCFKENPYSTGGAARVLYYVKKFRKEAEEGNSPPVIYLNAGDNFSAGRYTANEWKIIASYLNVLKTDAMCLGNHELNVGVDNLTLFLQHLQVPVVTANINFGHKYMLQKHIAPSRILQIKNQKIGIVGVTTARRPIHFLPKSVSITDEIQSLQTECSKLYSSGVRIIIILSHAGNEVDKLIAKFVDHVDVVVGCGERYGKQPRKYKDVVKRSDGTYVPIIRDASHLTTLGVFRIEFDSRGDVIRYGGRSIYLHSKIPQDVEALKLQVPIKQRKQHLGVTLVALDGSCKSSECNFGNLVADAIIDYKATAYNAPENAGKRKGWTNYPIALINAGAVFRTITRGYEITDDVLKDNMLFDDTLVLQKLTGRELVKALLEGTEYHGFTSGYFLQFSGLRVQYNMTKLNYQDRLLRIHVRCGECDIPSYSPLELDTVYNIMVNFKTYLNIDTLNQQLKQPIMDPSLLGDLTVKYLEKSAIFAEAEDRLRVLAEASRLTTLPFYLYPTYIIILTVN